MTLNRLLPSLSSLVLLICLASLSFSEVEILSKPNAFDLGEENYLFTDAFLSEDNTSVHIITHQYADFAPDYEDVELHVSNQEERIRKINTTAASSSNTNTTNLFGNVTCEMMYSTNASDAGTNFSHHGYEPCLTSMKPTSVTKLSNHESPVVITFRNELFPRLLRQTGDSLKVTFTYKDRTAPLFKLNGQPLVKNSTISMFTLFKNESKQVLKVWIQYYAELGVDQFLLYFNGNPKCIEPKTCAAKEKAHLCIETKELPCFIQELRAGKSDFAKKHSHINFLFVAWNYQYWHKDIGNADLSKRNEKYHARSQAITSVVYRARGRSSWLMMFDPNDFALPGEKALSFKEQLSKYSTKNISGLYYNNRYAGFEDRLYDSIKDEKYDLSSFHNEVIAAGPSGTYGDKSKMIIVPKNVDLMGVNRVISSSLRRSANFPTKKHHDPADPNPKIPPELKGLVVSAKSSFLHLISSQTRSHATGESRAWKIVGGVKSQTRYRLFDVNLRFKPMIVPNFDGGVVAYSQYEAAVSNGALLPLVHEDTESIKLRKKCISDAKERIVSIFSNILNSVEAKEFRKVMYIGPSFSPQDINGNLYTLASFRLLSALKLSIEYCGNSISKPLVDMCADAHILDECNRDNCLIYIQPGYDWGSCIDPNACISDKDRAYRRHILKLGNDNNITVLSGPQSLMFTDLDAMYKSIANTNKLSSRTIRLTWRQHSAWEFASLNYTGAQSYEVPDLLFMLGKLTTFRVPRVDVVVNIHKSFGFKSVVDGNEVKVRLHGKSLCNLIRNEMNLTCKVVTLQSPKLIELSLKMGKREYLNSSLAQGIMATTTGKIVITDSIGAAILPYMTYTGVLYIDGDSHSHSYSESVGEVFSSALTGGKKSSKCLKADNGLKEAHDDDVGGLVNGTIALVNLYTGKALKYSSFNYNVLSDGDYISRIGGTIEKLSPENVNAYDEDFILPFSTSGTGYSKGKKRSKQAKEYLFAYMIGLYFLLFLLICFGPASHYFNTSVDEIDGGIGDNEKNHQPYIPVSTNENESVEFTLDGATNVLDDSLHTEENRTGLELSEIDGDRSTSTSTFVL